MSSVTATVAYAHARKFGRHPTRMPCVINWYKRISCLFGRPPIFCVHRDHLSLKYLQSLKVSLNNRLARWALALQPYKFEIHCKRGTKLTAVDGISRRPFPEPSIEEDELKEDSLIAQVHTDILDSNVDKTMKLKKNRKPWTSITFDYENDDLAASAEEVLTTINDPLNVADGYNIQQLQRQSPDFIPILDYLEQGICQMMTKQQEN